jgi:hypothetical protein
VATPAPPDSQEAAEDPLSVLHFLLSCDSALAIHEVSAFLPRCPANVQFDVITECSSRLTQANPLNLMEPAGKATRKAIEELFLSELGNEAAAVAGAPGTDRFRIADSAAQALAESWPSKYEFDTSAPVEKRAAQIAAIRAKYKAQAKAAGTPTEPPR